jgi:hypothetical protein
MSQNQQDEQVYGLTNFSTIPISASGAVNCDRAKVFTGLCVVFEDILMCLALKLWPHRTHPDHETLMELPKKRDAYLRDYNPDQPAIGQPPYDLRIIESLIIQSRSESFSILHSSTNFLGEVKREETTGVRSARMGMESTQDV